MSTVVFGGKEETNFYDASKDGFSQKAGEISQGSYENSNIVQGVSLGNGYRGGRVLQVRKEFHSLFNGIGIYPDGVGTKVIPHASMGKQFIAAHDIAAMTLDDAILRATDLQALTAF